MKKMFFIIVALLLFYTIKAQEDNSGEGEADPNLNIDNYPTPPDGKTLTDRNFPLRALDNFNVVQCRKANSIPINFYHEYGTHNNLTDPASIKLKDLNANDKDNLCKKAWDTKEEKYFDLLVKLIFTDTLKKDHDIRMRMAKSLSAFNTTSSKKVLSQLLKNNDPELAMISAIILVQFGEYKIGFKYLSQHYHSYYPIEINTALMQIHSAESITLLKKIAKEQPDPAISLDALAALSLLGYCDYAYHGFVDFAKNKNEYAREKAAACLAYYIGTPEAFAIIKQMQNDKSYNVKTEVENILNHTKLKGK